MTAVHAAAEIDPDPGSTAPVGPAPSLAGLRALTADAMHAGVVTCPPHASLAVAARIMAAHRIHAVVVPSPAVPPPARAHHAPGPLTPGVVTDLDVLSALADGTLHDRTAADAARDRPPAPTVRADEELAHAVALMREHRATHLVVVHPRRGNPVGVLSTLDVAEVIAAEA